MTSVLNFGSSSSSNTIPTLDTSSLFSNVKLPTTFIIQPPSSSQPQSHTLLTKRCKPAELGDLLMKKIKTKTSSGSNSNQQSPTIRENSDDNLSNCLESTSMIEEINSPSTKSFCDETEVHNAHRMLEGVLIPQRSISTPLVNTFNLRHAKADAADNHRRVQHALEVLQKKMLMEQQASLLKEILLKCQAVQEPLIIPPLISASDSTPSPLTAGKSKKNPIKGFEDEDVIFGPIEYPLLSMAPPGFSTDLLQKEVNLPFAKASTKGLFGSLAATRAETQRSDSDEMSSCESEESPEGLDVKRRRSKKAVNAKKLETGKGKKGDKKEKGQGKEKTKTRKQK